MNAELSLKHITRLLHEYRQLTKKPSDQNRISKIEWVLGQISLTGEQLMRMGEFDPLELGDNDIERSIAYQELKDKYEKLEERHERLEARYNALVQKVEDAFAPQFKLKDLLDKQTEEIIREGRRE